MLEHTAAPLFSFAILSYNNYKYITETLDSLFEQTYPNIELLISNDASLDFDETELREYIDTHKRENITRVFINNNLTNIGTVQNVELVRKEAKGTYIMYMAADDALYDKTILQRYADEFKRLGDKAMLVTCKTAMCGHDLDDVISMAPDIQGINAIKRLSGDQMFSRLTHTFTIPTTSTAYRMTLYDFLGGYDTDYFIIEDAPLYIRMAREGISFHWIDGLVGARHRDGGISHGNTLNLSEGYRRYRYDEITFFQKEVLPYEERILPDDLKKAHEKWKWIQREYDRLFILPNLTKKERMMRRLNHAPQILKHMLERFWAQVPALLLDHNTSLLLLSIGLGCLTLFAVCLLGFALMQNVAYFVLAGKLLNSGIATVSIWLALQVLKLVVSMYKSIRFILIGR